METIERHFSDAGLELALSKSPIVRTTRGSSPRDDVVQLDVEQVRSASRMRERYRIFRGADGNRVEVLGTDRALRQLVLFVHEPQREFVVEVSKRAVISVDETDIVRELRHTVLLRRRTSPEKRHYLLGVDERHLFIAQLPSGVSTVRGAHEALLPEEVAAARRRGMDVPRQGEWFFLEPRADHALAIEQAAKAGRVRRREPIGAGGHPHLADEIVRYAVEAGARFEVAVRGSVRHVEHATLQFRHFRRVIRNRERIDREVAVNWID